jgi:hypothetical protein
MMKEDDMHDAAQRQLERDWEHLGRVLARSQIVSVSEEVHAGKAPLYSSTMETPIRCGDVYVQVEVIEPNGIPNEFTFTPREWREIKP